jgi:nitroreductase
MEALMATIQGRRSIRKYEDRDVPADLLNQLLEAVRWSPSWTNCQCWEIVVVRSADTKARLQETIAPKNPATKAIVAAPVVLALCARTRESGYYSGMVTTKFGDWFMYDLGLATQSLCLAAHKLGLGTVIVGLLDHDKAGAVLNVPETMELVTLIPVGFPAKTGKAPDRKPVSDFVRDESF